MKKYLKIFVVCFVLTLIIGNIVLQFRLSSLKTGNLPSEVEQSKNHDKPSTTQEVQEKILLKDAKNLSEAVAASNRVNLIITGTDGERTDTIIMVSYDVDTKSCSIMSIPRDTYIQVPGYTRADQQKINAVYGMKGSDGGMDGLKTQVSQLLEIPIHYYVSLDYKAVANVMDIIGGVEVNIKQKMFYDDPTTNPPLHIYFEPGRQTIKGQNAVNYLRWRQNNDGSGGGSDLDRNARQIEVAKLIIKKSLTSFKIINVVNTAFKYVKTDMSLDNMLYYSTTLSGFDVESDLKVLKLPGTARLAALSYFIHDPEQTQKLMYEMYMGDLIVSKTNSNSDTNSSKPAEPTKPSTTPTKPTITPATPSTTPAKPNTTPAKPESNTNSPANTNTKPTDNTKPESKPSGNTSKPTDTHISTENSEEKPADKPKY